MFDTVAMARCHGECTTRSALLARARLALQRQKPIVALRVDDTRGHAVR